MNLMNQSQAKIKRNIAVVIIVITFLIALITINITNKEAKIDINEFSTSRLIVTSETSNFNTYGALSVTPYDDVYVLSYENKYDCSNAYYSISKNNKIASVEIDSIMKIEQNGEAENEENPVNVIDTDLKKYIDEQTSSKEVIVAILDTGINRNNEIFDGRIIESKANFSTSGEINSIIDDNGHGTEMAEIIAKNSNQYVKLMPIKVANNEGKSSIIDTYKGIKYAIENGANVINISMNVYKTINSQILNNIINMATEKGIIVVTAAGNDTINVENVTPSNIDSAIVVSAIDEKNCFASYSNYGRTVDYCSYGTYNGKIGTSYATANVTGIIAMLQTSTNNAIDILNKYSIDLGIEGFDNYFGNGFIGLAYNQKAKEDNEIPKDCFENTIFDVNWKILQDEELDKYLQKAKQAHLAVFLQNMEEEDRKILLQKDTILNWEHTIYKNNKDENGNYIVSESYYDETGELYEEYLIEEDIKLPYYEYLLGLNVSQMSISDLLAKKGSYTLNIKGGGVSDTNLVIGIEVGTLDNHEAQTATYSVTAKSNNHNFKLTSTSATTKQGLVDDVNVAELDSEGNPISDKDWDGSTIYKSRVYDIAVVNFSYTRYAYTYSTSQTVVKTENARFNANSYNWQNNKPSTLSTTIYSTDKTDNATMQVNFANAGMLKYGDNIANGVFEIIEKRPTLTVHYVANGGSVNTNSEYYKYDINEKTSKFDFGGTANLINFSTFGLYRTGYERKDGAEWNTNANGTGTSYDQDIDYTVNSGFTEGEVFTNKDVYVYAQWTPITYNINYTLNGGNVSGNPTSYTINTNTITLKNPTREGYLFAGWTGTGLSSAQTNVTIPKGSTGNREYTANWTPITYTVRYDGNGATSGSTPDSSHQYDIEKNLTTNGYNKVGHNFKNWNTRPDGTGTTYVNNQSVKNLTSINGATVTLYAQWEAWALKAKVSVKDIDTKNIIKNPATVNIYAYNKNTSAYDTYVMTLNRNTDNIYETQNYLTYSDTNQGKFRIIEEIAPNGYYGDWLDASETQKICHDINIEEIIRTKQYLGQAVTDKGTISLTIENSRTKGEISVNIIDKETQGIAQGDATLDGAIYELYARENIIHGDGVSPNIKTSGQLVAEATTVNGRLTYTNIELGSYYVKQKRPSNGYKESNVTYNVDIRYVDEKTEIVYANITAEQQVKKQAFQLMKVGNNGDSDEYSALANVGFKIYLISSLEKVKSGEIVRNTYGYNQKDFITYDFTNESTAKDYTNTIEGANISEIFTDEEGYLVSPELAYGEYIVIESTVPENRTKIQPFIVTVEEDNRTPKKLRIFFDKQFTSKIQVEKRDSETKNVVLKANASYKIWNKQTEDFVVQAISYPSLQLIGTEENPYRTDETGTFTTPLTLEPGEYELHEVTAPEGYVLSGREGKSEKGQYTETPQDNVTFIISSTAVSEYEETTGDALLKVVQYNDQQVGSITITTYGEILKEHTKDDEENINFKYVEKPIEGIEFAIYAKEDIYSQDNHKQIVYNKDQEIAKMTSDENGKAIFDNLPLGNYYIKEVNTVNGFAINTNEREVKIDYEGQDIAVVYKNETYKMDRQKVEIELINKDLDKEDEIPIGAIWGIYTKEAITYIDENGEERSLDANQLIYVVQSDENGIARWNAEKNVDLPIGSYYIKQIKAPDGYIINTNPIEINTYGRTEKIIKITTEMYNSKTSINILKTDINENAIENAELQIVDSDGNVTETIKSTKEKYNIKGLETEKEYMLKETKPAPGYVTEEPKKFSIDINGRIVTEEENLLDDFTMIMKDEKTKISISIIDEDTGEKIPGVHVQIVDKETGEVVYEYDTTDEEHIIEGLPIKEYEVIQDITEDGYVTTESTINVEDKKGEQENVLVQGYTKVLITIKDEEDGTNIKDADIYIRDKETQEIIASTNPKENDENVIKIEQTEDGYLIQKLPIGEYEIEVKVPDGYKEIDKTDLKVENTEELQKKEILTRKLRFDVNVNKKLEKIIVNGKEMETNQVMTKIEIKTKEIMKVDLKLQYVITVYNAGEVPLKIGTIEDELPSRLELLSEESDGWVLENGVAINKTFAEEILQPGQEKEVRIVAKWKNSATNFGEKINIAKVLDCTNEFGYADCDTSNDIGKVTTLISVGTGLETTIMLIFIALIMLIIFAIVCIICKIKEKQRNCI